MAELYQLQGELLLAQGADEAEVEVYHKQAIEVVRRQSASSLALRAVMSLSRIGRSKPSENNAGKCSRRFTVGLRRDTIRQTCKQLKSYWKNSHPVRDTMLKHNTAISASLSPTERFFLV